ncbi:MAG: glycosyltransferase family protein [Actinomycetota bacterium]
MDEIAVLAVVQARMSSSRLPGKVLETLGDSTVLARVVTATSAASTVDRVVVATSTGRDDDPVVEEADRLGVAVVRGPEDDVLARFVAAIDAYPCEWVVRITADCPLLDPAIVDEVVAVARSIPSCDHLTTDLRRHLPRGLDAEVSRADALRRATAEAVDHHRSHVTTWFVEHPDRYVVRGLELPPDDGDLRVTLDTAEDLALLRAVVAELGAGPHHRRSVVELLRRRADLVGLNAGVRQKALHLG